MIIFGLAEIVTGFIHSFLGLVTSQGNTSTYIGVTLGACYFVGGLLLLTKRKWAAVVVIVLLVIDIIGRIGMIIMGLYPVNTLFQITGITIGTSIAIFFAFYVGQNFKYFNQYDRKNSS